jgi:hypothetical protein
MPVRTAQTIWSSHREIVRARLTSSGDVVVLGAPVVEGEEPVPDVALARARAGDTGARASPGQRDAPERRGRGRPTS